MAIATLNEMYDNHDVFTGVVKIRKGLALQLMSQGKDWNSVHAIFCRFARAIQSRVNPKDPSAKRTLVAIQKILVHTKTAPAKPVCVQSSLYSSSLQAVPASDDTVQQVLSGKLALHQLETHLGDADKAVQVRRTVLQETGVVLQDIPTENFDFAKVHGVNCEAVIGYMPLPVGVVGPFKVDGTMVHVPLATTEGALVASTQRGCKALNSSGVSTMVLKDGMTRAPLLQFPTAMLAGAFVKWVHDPANMPRMSAAFSTTTRFGKLTEVHAQLAGRQVFLRLVCFTGDAMGMNMVGKGSSAVLADLKETFPQMEVLSLSGNFCADKKAAAVNWIEGRGKSVVAEAVIPGHVVKAVLKTSVERIAYINIHKNLVGSAMAGAVGGYNAHAANIVAALFIATGQDPAQVVDSSMCMTLMEPINDGADLHVSCTMPCIEVGTIGGGTHLGPQSACLSMLNVQGSDSTQPGLNAASLARIVCAAVLAGETSLMAALASGDLIKSHMKLNRKGGAPVPPSAPAQAISSAPASESPSPMVKVSASRAQSFPATAWAQAPPCVRTYPEYDPKDSKGWFMAVCDQLIVEVQEELAVFSLPAYEQKWVNDMLEYNVKGGKMNRGLMVVESAKELFKFKGMEITNRDMGRFAVLGWCIEWLQAWLLIADDFMDSSLTRRGQPCWYKQEHVKNIALNDAFCVEMLVYKMLKRHFGDEEYYPQLIDLFMETTWQTEMGQMLDTLCMNLELKDFTVDRWTQIVQYKTAYYSFYCSVALGLILSGEKDRRAYDTARDILVTMGIYFQAQDDFLDCYATREVLGKIGTDIQDNKCGWLFVHAYNHLVSSEQKALLDSHYGKCVVDSEEELAIKALYKDLNLEELYHKYEADSYEQIMNMKPAVEEQGIMPWSIFEIFLGKVYKRAK